MRASWHSPVRVLLIVALVVGLVGVAPLAFGAAPTPTPTPAFEPVLSMSPSVGPIGIDVNVRACNLEPNGFANVTFNGRPWDTNVPIDSGGCMCGELIRVPDWAIIGDNTVTVTDGTVFVSEEFEVDLPEIDISPYRGSEGQWITVTGTGWAPHTSGSVRITFGASSDPEQNPQVATATPDASGAFAAQFAVPADLTEGQVVYVGAYDIFGAKASSEQFQHYPARLALSPATGQPETVVTVTGYGFPPYSNVELKFHDEVLYIPGLATDETGSFETRIIVPEMAIGGHMVVATVDGIVGNACFTITTPERRLTVSPPSGPYGTEVKVSACKMTPGATVGIGDVTINGIPWNTDEIPVDSDGCMCSHPLTVTDNVPVGENNVVVTDGTVTIAGTFTVTRPTITLRPTTARRGDTVVVNGSGWPAEKYATIRIQVGTHLLAWVQPGVRGTFTGVEFTVPLEAGGSVLVSATDILGNRATPQTLIVQGAELTLKPNSGLTGITVKVTGTKFKPKSPVEELTFAGTNIMPSGSLITSDVGRFETTFTLPGLPPGGQVAIATVADETVSACFTVLDTGIWFEVDEITTTPVEVALADILDKLVRVWGYENGKWLMYDPTDPEGSDLTHLIKGGAYWVRVRQDCSLVSGQELWAGRWNNIARL